MNPLCHHPIQLSMPPRWGPRWGIAAFYVAALRGDVFIDVDGPEDYKDRVGLFHIVRHQPYLRYFAGGVMIQTEYGLKQTKECIRLLESSLENLRREVLPKSKAWYDLMAEGPLEHIARMKAEIKEYKARQKGQPRRRVS